jgi:glycosyltransferase involved in cell wall biosynthesis
VYSAHNVEVDYARERLTSPLRGAVLRRVASLEAAAVNQSDLVVACTEADARRFEDLYAPEVVEVVPNGFGEKVDEGQGERLREGARRRFGIGANERVLLFLGGRAAHNVAALAALEEVVLPGLRRPATLLVAGRCAQPGSRRDGHVRVVRLGFVDDLNSVLAAADIALNPVSMGSGSSVKLADYLAAGLPVISTPVGMRGFERHRDGIQIAELAGFAEAIDAAAHDAAAPSRSPQDLSIEAVGRRLLEAYERIRSV